LAEDVDDAKGDFEVSRFGVFVLDGFSVESVVAGKFATGRGFWVGVINITPP
jgi:hypothetical protein